MCSMNCLLAALSEECVSLSFWEVSVKLVQCLAKCYLFVRLGLYAVYLNCKFYFETVQLNQLPWCFQAKFGKNQVNLSILSITLLDKFGFTQSVFKSIE